MQTTIERAVPVIDSARVKQLRGLFDLSKQKQSVERWEVDLPIEGREWNVGLIVGPSGSGKSTVARELFGEVLVEGFDWPGDKSIVDAFPRGMSIKEITGLLSSVGFSSPPAWLRPFAVLSNGQQFRVTLARALAELPELAVIDEFTSVVDREAAKVGSFAVQKSVRQRGQRLVAVTCHYDVIDWLDPDWVFQPHTGECDWRCERRGRPEIQLDIVRCDRAAWRLFAPHHYLSHSLSKSASCFAGLVDGRPATFTAVMSFPHPVAPSWREHRTVCLPDYQGVGLGNAFSELVASVMAATGRAYTSTTAHPAMIAHRARSPVWFMHRKPGQTSAYDRKSLAKAGTVTQRTQTSVAASRSTAGFRYCGPANREAAKALGVI